MNWRDQEQISVVLVPGLHAQLERSTLASSSIPVSEPWVVRAQLGRRRAILSAPGRFGPDRAKFGPNSPVCGRMRTKFGKHCAKEGRNRWPNSGKIRPNPRAKSPGFGRIRANFAEVGHVESNLRATEVWAPVAGDAPGAKFLQEALVTSPRSTPKSYSGCVRRASPGEPRQRVNEGIGKNV